MDYILSTVCSGIGSPEQACEELSQETPHQHKVGFYCEINKFARASYEAMFKAGFMVEDMTKQEWDGPEFYSDLIIGGIPCQAFSLAGLRKGELDPRGLLFYDYYRYVKKQKPKAFIIENVKGLISDNSGKTMQNWLHLLGQSVNGHHQMFNSPDSLPYNLHWTVLNTKDFGIPQNRERVFLVGIRDDLPNSFRFPIGVTLKLRLKDILEPIVDEKYYLSDKMMNYLNTRKDNFNNGKINYKNEDDIASCINASSKSIDISDNIIVTNDNGQLKVNAIVNCIDANYAKGMDNHQQRSHVLVKEATKQGYAIANDDPTMIEHRGHLDKEPRIITDGIVPTLRAESHGHETKVVVANTLDTACNQAVVVQLNPSKESGGVQPYQQNRVYDSEQLSPAIDLGAGRWGATHGQRIRRLTPLECWRLQGFPDEQFYKAQKVNSDSQLYKQAGNSMTKHVIKAIIKNVLDCILR